MVAGAAAATGPFVYPQRGQSAQQQDKDAYECYGWARSQSGAVLNTVSKVVPQLRLLTTVGGVASDTQVLVGRAGVEGEVLDGLTGQRLAAAVDRRAGTKALRGGVSTWADVQNAFDFWSERLRTGLAELREAG